MQIFRINDSKPSHCQNKNSFPTTYIVPNRPFINSTDTKRSMHVIFEAADTAL